MNDWWNTPAGEITIQWEQAQLDWLVADRFGFHAAQLGSPAICALRSNRMPHRWLFGVAHLDEAVESGSATHEATQLWVDDGALPLPDDCMDLLVLPHSLEWSADPHGCVREAYRVLRPEGTLVVTGFNAWSWWGASQALRRQLAKMGLGRWGIGQLFLPEEGEFLNPSRVKDWLRLMGMEIIVVRHGLYRPAVQDPKWIQRWSFMERWGAKWWPFLGAGFVVVAVKKVPAMRRISKKAYRRARVPAGARTATTMGASAARPTGQPH